MNGERRRFTITKLRLDDDGVWRARVTVDGDGVDVDRLFGSWRVTPKHEGSYREVPATGAIAQELQRQVRALENARKPKKVVVTNGQAETIKAADPPTPTPERFVALG